MYCFNRGTLTADPLSMLARMFESGDYQVVYCMFSFFPPFITSPHSLLVPLHVLLLSLSYISLPFFYILSSFLPSSPLLHLSSPPPPILSPLLFPLSLLPLFSSPSPSLLPLSSSPSSSPSSPSPP